MLSLSAPAILATLCSHLTHSSFPESGLPEGVWRTFGCRRTSSRRWCPAPPRGRGLHASPPRCPQRFAPRLTPTPSGRVSSRPTSRRSSTRRRRHAPRRSSSSASPGPMSSSRTAARSVRHSARPCPCLPLSIDHKLAIGELIRVRVFAVQSAWLHRETGAKCYMVAASAMHIVWGGSPQYWRWIPRQDSRFAQSSPLFLYYY